MKQIFSLLILLPLLTGPLYSEQKGLIPDTVVSQFAGYIGFISAGLGYEFYNEKLNLEILYGYVPESLCGIDIHMLTGRAVISPLSVSLGSGYTIYPLTIGIFVNYAEGSQYHIKWPSFYPEWYYRPTALYTGESVGIRIKKNRDSSLITAVEFFADIVTMTEYAYEYYTNERITLDQILSLALGVRIHF